MKSIIFMDNKMFAENRVVVWLIVYADQDLQDPSFL